MAAPDRALPVAPFERPVRVPGEVECQIAEPPVARAGERARWRLPFVLSEAVPEGSTVGLLIHGGRNVKGVFRPLQADEPTHEGHVALRRSEGEAPPLTQEAEGTFSLVAPAGGLTQGETVQVDLGGEGETVAARLSLPSKMVLLFVPMPDESGSVPPINAEPAKRIIGACLVHITGAGLHHLRAYAPSEVKVGEAFDILIRAEDEFSNVACERPGRLVVRADGEELDRAERVDGEHSSSVRLRGLRLGRAGVHRLEVEDADSELSCKSNPVRCVGAPEGIDGLRLWGMIHGHTEFSDGAGSIEHYFRYVRDDCLLDFGAPGDHDHVYETSDEMWAATQDAVARHNAPGRFVTLLGYEWAKWRQNGDGDRNVYYRHDHRPLYRSDNGHCPTPGDLYRALAEEDAIVIPHHSANRGNHCDWKDYDPEKERLVEIYSEWGSSECGVHEGNPYPMRPWQGEPERADSGEVPAGFVQRALVLGWRAGFTAGGDDHNAHPGDQTPRDRKPSAGLMAVKATARTRDAIWQAMYERNCYGTTGARLIVDFTLNGAPMGSELFLEDDPELLGVREVRIAVNGTAPIERIEVLRNNEVILTHRGSGPDEAVEFEDRDPFPDVALPAAPHWPTPFCFYYVRVTQVDGEMAWVSPIWVSPRRA